MLQNSEKQKEDSLITDFPWNDNKLVDDIYNTDNYKVIDTDVHNGRALILFSGNGLYYPNTEETFRKTIVLADRYEFENICKSKVILKSFEKIVLVRDIFKQWYIAGINRKYDSIEKTISFLDELLSGYSIVTCGISAGGYMATVAGIGIKAEMIINVSGQWRLDRDNKIYMKYADGKKNIEKYLSVQHDAIRDNKENIFYFYPAGCEQDIKQHDYCKEDLKYVFPMDVSVHGALLRGETWPHLVIIEKNKLIGIHKRFENEIIKPEKFFDVVVPGKYKVKYRIKHLVRMICEKQKDN